ncbi:putative lipid scramblase CLPTM1 [Corticium candelabrum]|uniref:putative lipid scramblase CLPTM1 n=1 Tax=Corticium candelabrum TaxID=121492 RepID=UPI002E26120B|nr:putative lipid scramblase CLPTM1 [Corticium candelabrum]
MSDQSASESSAVQPFEPSEPSSGEDSTRTVAPQNEEQQEGGRRQQGSMFQTLIWRLLVFWFISNLLRRSFGPKTDGGIPSKNIFDRNQLMDLHVYLAESKRFSDFGNQTALFWFQEDIEYGSWSDGENSDGTRTFSSSIQISENVKRNGSLYVHVFLTKSGVSPDPTDESYERLAVVHSKKRLNIYKRRRVHKTANLLTGEADVSPGSIVQKTGLETPTEIISYWHPNLTINVIDDQTAWIKGSIPPPVNEYVKFDNQTGDYYPIVYFNDFWNLASEYTPINETTPKLNLTLTYGPLSLFRWQMYLSQQQRSQWMKYFGETETEGEDEDSLKQALIETNPYLLGLTIIVSLLHTVFEFLAFKNDVQFWKSRKSLEGLSVRSVFFNVFQSIIVVLYVLDNDTNVMVIFSCIVGLGIDLWKITKVVDVKIDRQRLLLGFIPRITYEDKSSYTESSTKQYDLLAFKYLSILLFPLFVAYGVYSLLYQEHKGWYSFCLGMSYGFLLTFGFIMMTPQLFINYKLKSVAHLPWRMLTYKALNTFIDDLFAFVIRMPMMYRIGCLRDDVVFIIYVYQRWIYPVDPTRMNEFGGSGEQPVVTPLKTETEEVREGDDSSAQPDTEHESDLSLTGQSLNTEINGSNTLVSEDAVSDKSVLDKKND